jgi:uncharacterized protein YdcH (DUF465 family)
MKHPTFPELESRRLQLDNAIHELDRRGDHMTPEDRQRATALKKLRLATKDQLDLRRRR